MAKQKRPDKSENEGHAILGDIRPDPAARDRIPKRVGATDVDANDEGKDEMDEPLGGGSRKDRSKHPGSRDVTEGVTGGTGTETGGTRNYRQGTGATGGDIGNRPE